MGALESVRSYAPQPLDGSQRDGQILQLLRWRPTENIGHNALAGAAYAIVYLLALIEIVTGFALVSQVLGSRFWTILTGWPLRLMDIQYVREIHFFTMFLFWMFFLHHLYSAMLVSKEEKTGVMESIFSGYKFFPEEVVEAQREPGVSRSDVSIKT